MKLLILAVSLLSVCYGQKKENQYVIVLEIKQSSFTLDVWQHVKNAMNKVTVEVPTTKDYYDKVKVGDNLADGFRTGSFIVYGSISDIKLKIINKKIVESK